MHECKFVYGEDRELVVKHSHFYFRLKFFYIENERQSKT
jgi:hypothetical protein